MVGYCNVVQVGKRKMRIAMQAHFGQMNNRHISTKVIQHLCPFAHEVQTACPFI